MLPRLILTTPLKLCYICKITLSKSFKLYKTTNRESHHNGQFAELDFSLSDIESLVGKLDGMEVFTVSNWHESCLMSTEYWSDIGIIGT